MRCGSDIQHCDQQHEVLDTFLNRQQTSCVLRTLTRADEKVSVKTVLVHDEFVCICVVCTMPRTDGRASVRLDSPLRKCTSRLYASSVHSVLMRHAPVLSHPRVSSGAEGIDAHH